MENEVDCKTGIKWSEYSKEELIKRRDELVMINLECRKTPVWLNETISYLIKIDYEKFNRK
jgi:hypothetical protein